MSGKQPSEPGPWIRIVREEDADFPGELGPLYDGMRDRRGQVDNVLQIHSLHPKSLRVHLDFYKLVMYGRSPLTRIQREMVAVAVSTANGCHY